MAGTIAGQGVVFAATPILTRQYSPADFGAFSLAISAVMLLTPVMSARTHAAIPLPAADHDAARLALFGIRLSLATSAALMVLLISLRKPLEGLLVPISYSWALLPLIALLVCAFQILNAWTIRIRKFGRLALRSCIQQIAVVTCQIAAAFAGLTQAGLLVGYAIGQSVGVALLITRSLDPHHTCSVKESSPVRQYRGFLARLTLAGVINQAGLQAPLVVIALLYGAEAAGVVGVTQRILSLPITLIGQSVANVYLGEIARAHRDRLGTESSIFFGASRKLAMVSIVLLLAVEILAPRFLPLLLGPEWHGVGAVAQAFGVLMAAQLFAYPVSQTLVVYGQSRLQLAWDITRLATVVAVGCTSFAFGASMATAMLLICIATGSVYLWSWDLGRRTIRKASATCQGVIT